MAISYDRYDVIVQGLSGFIITKKRVAVILTSIWISSIALCVPPFFGWGDYKLGN